MAVFTRVQRKKGKVTSGVIFLFWLFSLVCGSFLLYSSIRGQLDVVSAAPWQYS